MISNVSEYKSYSPSSNLNGYLNQIYSLPILTFEEEQELARKSYFQDDVQAAKKLALHHLRFVVHIAKGFYGYGLSKADLIQEGNIGLIKAIKKFDPEKGFRLATFASYLIKSEIYDFVLKNWKIVKIATTKAQKKLFFNLKKYKKSYNWFSDKEIKHISEDLGISSKDVRQMEGRILMSDKAFECENKDDDSMGKSSYKVEYSQDSKDEPEKNYLEYQSKKDYSHSIENAIKILDERSLDIIKSRWLAEDENKLTLHDLAKKYSISAERVRQIEKKALEKMKNKIEVSC
jgi:RNA polymerase sigma-32 factor